MADHNPFPGENNTGHIWDSDLRELQNPPPRWWMIGFWTSILWVIGYTILYPSWPVGEEPTPGILGWTQIEEYERGVAQIEARRAEFESRIGALGVEEILADPGLTQYTLASAKVLFGDNCAACHGSGGQGNPGYPVLADDDWLYGGSTAKLTETITQGRKGNMLAHQDILSAEEVDTLARWTVEMSQGEPGSEAGWQLFSTKGCSGCHGPTANGVLAELPGGEVITVGAADLTDRIWRFEPGGYESARHTILYGVNQSGVEQTREAVMPAFGPTARVEDVEIRRLDPQEIKKLVVYVRLLGGGL
ncbi:cytochrome-c oxidase, cbb3-type subunit III [Marichromatium gracile]|uniref:Cbb3-type cytochrome c oxidase subunit n=1 Tax=Marichromatium gracile TaxID=1048 RepID=A0A4R4ADY5_MARGR|nr:MULTISPECIES: cytochrome-c oxidase, cbb3-type subunit III [Marichromatium]MBO8086424.1 cytochrome-c oxidase, cbb3-type subunit III [Marichromatium sp.]MBK1710495.1 cytochrome-c oxidase, cbb3-type subunit III [Marichromatium gracile]MCF1182740.1 cytochrome-c oxidase, cbb3-type subunit III [Marichromatium gracile]RNE90595.1 cytochrome-c oxidase, cbb3-type subunit III [Marichromatium sp. AB31]RNE94002.1 cytochrome-c oxidase, cbb3-type subunit III [Marichromatium sp. AB32]